MTAIKTSQRQCNEVAELLTSVSGKCCEFFRGNGARTCEVWFDGNCHEFKTNSEAYEFMVRELLNY